MEEKRNVETLLKEGNTVKFHPTGTSMVPLLVSPDDYVIVSPVNRSLKWLDVCVYRRENGPLIIHRICRIKGENVWFVGDRQKDVEGPLPISSVLGIMQGFTRKNKEFTCKSVLYRTYSLVWMLLRPFRLYFFHFARIMKKIFEKE